MGILKVRISEALVGIYLAVGKGTKAGKHYLLTSPGTVAIRKLLPCFLYYFLFAELSGV